MSNKRRKISLWAIALLIVVATIDMPANTIRVFANESSDKKGVVVTKDTFGSDDSLYRIQIGYDVTDIEDGAFSGLKNLQVIDVDSKNPYYASYDGCLYNKDCTVLLCIPQNTSSVQMLKSVKYCSEHALDGLSKERKDRIYDYINGRTTSAKPKTSSTEKGSASVGNYAGNTAGNKSTQKESTKTITENKDLGKVSDQVSDKKNQPEAPSSDEFQQYVHEEYGKVTFRYTGTGRSVIVVPEGVEKIASFSQGMLTFNDEITTIYLPSTLKIVSCAQLFKSEGDDKYYGAFYQCRNLQNVYGGSYNYDAYGSYVKRPYNDIIFWSNSERCYYDESQYDGLKK